MLGPVLQTFKSGAWVCVTQAGGALVPTSCRPAPRCSCGQQKGSYVGPCAPDKLLNSMLFLYSKTFGDARHVPM